MKIRIQYKVTGYVNGTVDYHLLFAEPYWSNRYEKKKTLKDNMYSDGASGALDVPGSLSWWVHDAICNNPFWDDGTPITAWQAATVLSDILFSEGRRAKNISAITSTARGYYWFWATFLFGCKKSRANGWF